MFTKKTSRREQTNGSRYIEPFEEADTEGGEHKPEARSTGYMAELEAWLDEFVFEPIEYAITTGDTKELHIAFAEGKQHIKRKVLASYHNGLKAKQTSNYKTNGYRQRTASR